MPSILTIDRLSQILTEIKSNISGGPDITLPLSVANGGTGVTTTAEIRKLAVSGSLSGSIEIGEYAKSTGNYAISIGNYAKASGNNSVYIGGHYTSQSGSIEHDAKGNGSVAIGYGSSATNDQSTAIGGGSRATGYYSICLGFNSESSGYMSTSLGYAAKGNGQNSLALGYNSTVTGNAGAAGIGASTAVSYNGSTAIGHSSTVTGENQNQIGYSNTTTYVYGAVQNRSDARDKANITDLDYDYNRFVQSLKPRNFQWDYREDYRPERKPGEDYVPLTDISHDGTHIRSRRHNGFIAQEVKAVMDEMDFDFAGYQDHSVNGGQDVLSLGYEEFIAPMVACIQDLMKENEQLRADNANIMAELALIKKALNM